MATNGVKGQKLAKTALAKNNSLQVTIVGDYEADRQRFQSMAQDLGVTFDGNNNVLDNTIKDNTASNTAHRNTTGNPHSTTIGDISGLQSELDSKLASGDNVSGLVNDVGYITGTTGYTGDVVVITGVDFVGETTTTQTMSFVNGVLTEVV